MRAAARLARRLGGAVRRRPKLVAVVTVVLALLGLGQLFALFEPRSLPEGFPVRVLLSLRPDTCSLEGRDITSEPASPWPPSSPIEVRVQSRGLLLVDGSGRSWALDQDTIVLAWSGRARLRCQGAERASEHLGRLAVTRRGASLELILHTALETYLTGVVAAEMGPRFHRQALAAQAVAARSFAWSACARGEARAWDLRDDETDQVYRGVSDEPAVVGAVRDTLGEFLLWQDKPLRAYYASTCGGRTRDGAARFRDVPAEPFRPVTCEACSASPLYRWTRRLPRDALLEQAGLTAAATEAVRVEATRKSERGDWIDLRVLAGARTSRPLPFSTLARLATLPSPWITRATLKGDSIELEGNGFGHGVGLCQYGAGARATAGWTYRAILAHYYPGCDVGALSL